MRTAAWLFAAMLAPIHSAIGGSTLDGFLWMERPLPEIAFVDGTGAGRTLADFEGRVVLLNIWATWCPPCRREMPSLDRLQGKLGGDDFMVLALSIDRGGREVIEEFYREVGIVNLGIFYDDTGSAPAELGVGGIPTTILVSAAGDEIGRKIGPAEWDSPEALDLIGSFLIATEGGECACPMGRAGTAKPTP
jgi:thiol-disulfide isomerase/thioredoxin